MDGLALLLAIRRSERGTVVYYLIKDCRANVEAMDTNGWTAMHHACSTQNLDIVQDLTTIGHANAHSVTSNGRSTALHLACSGNQDHVGLVQ